MRPLTPFLLAAALAGGVAAAAAGAAAAPASGIPWIEDDYSRAVSEARAKKLPIFLEAWAPW
jgi:hypothetical protein